MYVAVIGFEKYYIHITSPQVELKQLKYQSRKNGIVWQSLPCPAASV